MRGIRSDGRGISVASDLLDPQPGPGEAVVRVHVAGVSVADARLAAAPGRLVGTPGQECIGIVQLLNIPDDASASVRDKRSMRGKRVAVSPYVVCGHCELCRSGLSSHCRARQILGMSSGGAGGPSGAAGASGAARQGCLAERVCVPIANLIELPSSVSDDAAIFGVDLARAIHTRHLLRSEADSFITVIGDNLLALLSALALSKLSPSVRVLHGSSGHVRFLERWGIKHRPIDEAGRRQDQGVIVDCTGTAAGFRLALQHVRPRGMIVVKSPLASASFAPGAPLGTPESAWLPAIDLTPVVANELRVVGSGDGTVGEAVQALAKSEFDLEGLIAKRYRIEQGVEAMRAAGEVEPMKVVVDFGAERA